MVICTTAPPEPLRTTPGPLGAWGGGVRPSRPAAPAGLGVDGRYPSSKIPELSMISTRGAVPPVDRTVSTARLIPRTDGSAPDAVQPFGHRDGAHGIWEAGPTNGRR